VTHAGQKALVTAQGAGHARLDVKITAVAYDVGFGDLSYFYRVFRRRFGATPSDIRAQAKTPN